MANEFYFYSAWKQFQKQFIWTMLSHHVESDLLSVQISDFTQDSRKVKKNSLFFALTGEYHDGHQFIPQAIHAGAKIILCEDDQKGQVYLSSYPQVIFIYIPSDIKKILALFSQEFYANPSHKIKIIGITGTDGKSSCVRFLYQILKQQGKKVGCFSTVEYDYGEGLVSNSYRQSTPEANHIAYILAQAVQNELEYFVLEATSHGLSYRTSRLYGIQFLVAILSNISHEHIDFHGSMEDYVQSKANLFSQLHNFSPEEKAFAVMHYGQKYAHYFDFKQHPIYYCHHKTQGTLWISHVQYHLDKTQFKLHYKGEEEWCTLLIPTHAYLDNFLLCLACSIHLGIINDLGSIHELISVLSPPEGRMQFFFHQDKHICIDYAHTPQSFQKILSFIHPLVDGKLIIVFGSAGERDREKRSIQGAIASEYADLIILTDEDPRCEKSIDILNDIKQGIAQSKELYCIPNRKEAIYRALDLAEKEDLVLLLGKGHEKSIIYCQQSMDWNERECINQYTS